MTIRGVGNGGIPGVGNLEELLPAELKPAAQQLRQLTQGVVDGMGGPRAALANQPPLPQGPGNVDYNALTSDLDPDVARILGRSSMGEKEVVEALQSLGLETGATLNDPKTKEAIKQVQKAFDLDPTGELDVEALLAILEAKMADDRRSQASRASTRPSVQRANNGGGGGGGGGGGMNGAGGAGGANQTGGAGGAQNTQGAGNTAPVDVSNYQYQAGDVTPEKLVQMSPGLSLEKAREVAPHLNNAMREAGINTPARQAAFIAQLGHESGNFRYSEEIASGAAYEGRRDLGNTQPGDGERFKGRGYIQLTGRANYAAAGRALGLDLVNNPQLAARPENAARIAAWYWNSRGLNAKADAGDFAGITRSINGGTNGAADRNQRYQAALAALGRDRGNTQMA
jgi:predicted chitinase